MDMNREEKSIELLKELVKIPSLSGQEEKIAKFLKKTMEEYGYDEVLIDKYGSVLGCIKGNRPGKTVLFDGHMDTVPVNDSESWTRKPFGGEIVDGRLYGRGSSDMKGGVAAMVSAASYFAQDTNKEFAGKIYVSCSVHEECFEGMSSLEIAKHASPDLVVICEPTNEVLMVGQRGRAEIVVETEGKSCHSSNPAEGINAVYHMNALIDAIRGMKKMWQPQLGEGIMELVDITSQPYPGSSVVPMRCRATFDRRLLVGETEESVLAQIEEVIEKVKGEIPELRARAYYAEGRETCWTGEIMEARRFFPAWITDEKSEMVQKALTGIEKAGKPKTVSCMHFCSNGSGFSGMMGIEGIGYGPSRVELAHTRDEYIELSSLTNTWRTYCHMLEEWMK